MSLEYLYLSEEEREDVVAKAILEREKEHYHYELNRLNYESILKALKEEGLPDEWPEHLRQYRVLTGETLAGALTGEDYSLATRLQYRDRVRLLMATTITEQNKVETIYRALHERIPDQKLLSLAMNRVMEIAGRNLPQLGPREMMRVLLAADVSGNGYKTLEAGR